MGRKRRTFTKEFKAEAVRLAQVTGRSYGEVAKELDLTEGSLREWARRAEGVASGRVLDDADRAELMRLRRENRILTQERDFLKKAAAFFAKTQK